MRFCKAPNSAAKLTMMELEERISPLNQNFALYWERI
jgi:hypothetical protein